MTTFTQRVQHRFMIALCLLAGTAAIATTASQAATTPTATSKTATSKIATPQAANPQTVGSGQQLQVLRDCKVIYQRALQHDEQVAYSMLQQTEHNMREQQQPLEQMQQQLTVLQQEMDKVELQAGDPSHASHQRLRELGEQISRLTRQYQPEMTALENTAAIIEQDAKRFQTLIQRDLGNSQYDQIRVLTPGEQNSANDCSTGMFFGKSLQVLRTDAAKVQPGKPV